MLFIVLCLTAVLVALAYVRRHTLPLWIAAAIALGWSARLCGSVAWDFACRIWEGMYGA
jgi:uncharacterized membrane protein